MYAFILFACLLQISLQLDYIQVQWGRNEVFLSTGQSLQFQVSTVDISLNCSYPEDLAMWTYSMKSDRVRENGNRTLSISIFRLAENGRYTCQNTGTQQSMTIELLAAGTGLFHIDSNGNDLSLANGHAAIVTSGDEKAFICLSSLNRSNSAVWYFPNGSQIDNKVTSLSMMVNGVFVFDAISDRGVYRLELNGAFSISIAGLYQCRVKNSFSEEEIQDLYVYPNGTGYIIIEYGDISTQIVNNTFYIPIGTTEVNLTCNNSNSTWQSPASEYTISSQSIGDSQTGLRISLFTLGEVGTYQCIGSQTVYVVLKPNGSALTAISQGMTEKLTGHEVLTYTEDELKVLCLSANGIGVWYHPFTGRIDSDIVGEYGIIRVKQNVSRGVNTLVFGGELSTENEGVYRCETPNQQGLLSVGIYNGIDFITVESYPYRYQVYNSQFLALTPATEYIILSCPYPNDVWSLPANSNTSSSTLSDGRIYISPFNSETEGVYNCTNTSITILQATQQLVITVNGNLYNQSLVTIDSCTLPPNISCSLTGSLNDSTPPLKWYNSISREVGNATIDTSGLRTEDSGVYMCATDTLGYTVTANLEIRIIEANYIQLEYNSKTVPLVDGQMVDIDLLSLAVSLTCVGSLPYWSKYPASNYTRANSSKLVIDIFTLSSIGEYVCTDNITRDSTKVSFGFSSAIGVYQIAEDGSCNVISEEYPVVYLNDSQSIQLVCVTSLRYPCFIMSPWYTEDPIPNLSASISTEVDCANRKYYLTVDRDVLDKRRYVEYFCEVETESGEELVRKVAIYGTVSGYIHVYYDYTHYDVINNTSLYLPLGANNIILDCSMYFNSSVWLSYPPYSYNINAKNGELGISIFTAGEVGMYSCTDNNATVSVKLLPKATVVFSLKDYSIVPNNTIFTPRDTLQLLCLTAVDIANVTGWFAGDIFFHKTSLNITPSDDEKYFSCIASLDRVIFYTHNIRILPKDSGFIHIQQFSISLDIPSSGSPIVSYGTQGVKLSCSLVEGLISWRYPPSIQNMDEVCLVEGGILISNISSVTRGTYSCSNSKQNITISLNNIIRLTTDGISKSITGYEHVYLRIFSLNVTLTCDSPDTIWLIRLNQKNSTQIISTNYTSLTRQINGTSIEVNHDSVTIGSVGIFESGYYVCDPNTSRQTTVYLQSIGLALFMNTTMSIQSRIPPDSVFILSPLQSTSFTCVYGSLHQPPRLIHTNTSNDTVPLSNLVRTQLELETSQLNIFITPQDIDQGDEMSIQMNTALNGRYSCRVIPDFYITFTIYHKLTVTPTIKFYLNSTPISQQLIVTPDNSSNDLLECRASFLEPSAAIDSVTWLLDDEPITSNGILDLSNLLNSIGLYECRVYSKFVNASRTIDISILRVPTQPLYLTTSNVSSVAVTLSWTQPEFSYGTIISYLIEYTIQNNPTYTSNATAFITSITLTSLSPNSLYTVSVSARNSVGSGSLSDSINFRTLSNVPHAPESFTYSRLMTTSVQLTWSPPQDSSGVIIYYQISTTGLKSYDLLYEENLDPIRVDASSLWLQLEDLTPATSYDVSIVAVTGAGPSIESTVLSFTTPPGEISVIHPTVVTTPLRGLDSIVVKLEETSNRNAEIIFQLLLMVQLPLDYDTVSFEINHILSTLNFSRTARDAKNPVSIIRLSVVANISSDNCYAFPNHFIVGGEAEFHTCNFSILLNTVKLPGSNIRTNYFPQLQFGFQYAFALMAVTRENAFYTSTTSAFIELLEPVNDGILSSVIYLGATLGAVVVLFVLIIIACCFILCCVVNYFNKTKKSRLKRHYSDAIPTLETSLINVKKNSFGFSNPLVTIENALISTERLDLTEVSTDITQQPQQYIFLEDLGNQMELFRKNNNEIFTQDYNRLDERMETEAKAAKEHCNRHLNRFVDIFPYDDSRVVLTPIPDNHMFDHDYINASFIDGYDRERSYIVTQVPLLDTICDFWRLCWEYNVTVITYFTDSIAKVRNSSYWPDNVITEVAHGPFIIKLTEMIINRTYIRRSLTVKNQQYPDEIREIHQFHFTSWPDTGFPEISKLLNFHTLVKSFYISQDQSGPLLVHCRSGIGPSAVFLALDILTAQARTENRISVQKCINSMRSMRAKMMCSLDYYIFLHDLLLTALTSGDTCIDAPFIPRYMKQLLETDNLTHSDGYHNEYTVLEQISVPPKDYPRTIALQNASKNRNKEFIPINSRIVKLEKGEYINATLLNGYSSDNSFIIAESPLHHTVANFWNLIFEYRCHAVVMLCELEQEQEEVCAKYWMDSGEPVIYGDLTVQLSNIIHPEHCAFTIHTFVLTSNQTKDLQLEVKQYIYHDWNAMHLPTNYNNLVKLISAVLKGYHGKEHKNPILVHCSDTVGLSGVFCCALYCIERLIEENVVDVFGCVRYLRGDKPGLVNTEEYYRSIYETILSYIST